MSVSAAIEIRTRPCPACLVCGTKGTWLYRDLRDGLFKAPGQWSFRKCPTPNCGLIWLDPMPLEADLPLAYRSYYTHQDTPSADKRRLLKALYHGLLRLTGLSSQRQRLMLMELDTAAAGRLLDVGCGDGRRLMEFRARGWEVEGQEVDALAAERVRRTQGVQVHLGELHRLALTEASYDAVVMNHVLEHVPDPIGLLQECHRLLRPGGTLVVVTPNADSLGYRCFGSCWLGLDPPRHLHLFSPRNLRPVALRAGLGHCRIQTSAANATSFAAESLMLWRQQQHRTGVAIPLSRAAAAVGFQLLASLLHLLQPLSGEECLLKTSK